MKKKNLFVAASLVSIFGLAGCNTTGTAPNATAPTDNRVSNATGSVPSAADEAAGIEQMQAQLKTLRSQLDQNDASGAKATGAKLEDTWSSFEDGIKANFKQDYETVEDSLDPLVSATGAKPLDKSTIQSLADALDNALLALKNKVQP